MMPAHPKKTGPQAVGKSRGGWNTKIHIVAADARTGITFSLSPVKGVRCEVVRRLGLPNRRLNLIMDHAYEGNGTRQLHSIWASSPSFPPLRTRVEPRGVRSRDARASQQGRALVSHVQRLSTMARIPPENSPKYQSHIDLVEVASPFHCTTYLVPRFLQAAALRIRRPQRFVDAQRHQRPHHA